MLQKYWLNKRKWLAVNKISFNQPISAPKRQNKSAERKVFKQDFQKILRENFKNNSELKFSKHAKARLESRNINFNNQEINTLEKAISKAKDKGAKESLVLINDNAYIVSVQNNTVITAMDKKSMEENVFTNIDSAIVMK